MLEMMLKKNIEKKSTFYNEFINNLELNLKMIFNVDKNSRFTLLISETVWTPLNQIPARDRALSTITVPAAVKRLERERERKKKRKRVEVED